MSLLDFSLLVFFATCFIKAMYGTYEYWRDYETTSEVSYSIRPSRVNPKHIPAPSRPSPRHIEPRVNIKNSPSKRAVISPLHKPESSRPAIRRKTAS